MSIFGYFLGIFGYFWVFLGTYGYFWVFVGVFGYFWVFLCILVIFGNLSTFYWTVVIGSECNFFWDRHYVVWSSVVWSCEIVCNVARDCWPVGLVPFWANFSTYPRAQSWRNLYFKWKTFIIDWETNRKVFVPQRLTALRV